jgi:hypothetical protein
MSKNTVLAHFGFPKCASTSLQRGYFPKLENAEYIGVKGANNLEYSSLEWSLFFETALIYYNDLEWDKYYIEARAFVSRNTGKIAFSFEHIIFDFFPGMVGLETRLRRLRQVFDDRIDVILLIIRKPSDLVVSLYKEYLRLGLPMGYSEFIDVVVESPKFPRAFFRYDDVFNKVADFFPEAQLLIEKLETLNFENLAHTLSEYGYVINSTINNIEQNVSMDLNEVIARIEYNKQIQFDFGGSLFEMPESHRKEAYFNLVLDFERTEKTRFLNVELKRRALEYKSPKASIEDHKQYKEFTDCIKDIFNEEDSLY